MLDRIIVNVVEMVFEIPVISNDMIPKPLLPELHGLRRRQTNHFLVFFGEIGLERVHDVTEIAFASRLDNEMKMVGKKDITQHRKGMKFFDTLQDFAQEQNHLGITKNRFAILHHLRDKYGCARDIIAAKIHDKVIQ